MALPTWNLRPTVYGEPVDSEEHNHLIEALMGLTATEMVPQPWRDRAVATNSLTLTTSMQDVPGASLTLPYISQYLVLCFWEMSATDGYVSGQLVVDGVAQDPPVGFNASGSASSTLSGVPGGSVSTSISISGAAVLGNAYLVTTAQADRVAKLQACRVSATSGNCGTQSSILAVHLGPAGVGASLKGTGSGGLIDDSLYLLKDGSRALTGNMAANPGVTFDGVDVSAHAASADAHHAKSHAHNGSDGSGSIDHANLSNKGTNTHTQIDTHLGATGTAVHGLGDSSTKNVGTAAGTVAAGDHSHSSIVSNTGTIDASNSQISTTASRQDVPNCSRSLAAGTYLIIGTYDIEKNNTNDDRTFVGECLVNGVAETPQALGISQASGIFRMTITRSWVVTLGSTYTVKLTAKHAGGTTGEWRVYTTHTTMTAVRLT